MSILASAGRAKMYHTNGSGRDSYIVTNCGGFSIKNEPAPATRPGGLGMTQNKTSAQHIARGGG